MRNFIILCLLLACLSGCLTPHSFRRRHGIESGHNTTYKVTDYKNGFRIDMTFHKFEAAGTSQEINFDAREKIKNLASWIAEARKQKIRKIKIKDIDSSHYHNTATQYTSWKGNLRVYYTKK